VIDDAWEGRRVIPTLLVDSRKAIKTRGYSRRGRYIGDLVNLLRIFSDKQVDEILVVDRSASRSGIDIQLLEAASAECFAPLGYSGGIRSVADAERVIAAGVDKVTLTTAAEDPQILTSAAKALGSQAIVAGLDVTRSAGRHRVVVDGARLGIAGSPAEHARRAVDAGAGEVFLNATWLEGRRGGYDLGLLRSVLTSVSVPVTVCGGAGTPGHLLEAFRVGAAAAAAGTMFVFFGPFDAVLPTYVRPTG
jgi:cyclase